MKKTIVIAPLLLLLLVFSCKKVEQLLKFTVNVTQNSRVPPPSIFYTGLPAPVTVTTNSASSFSSNNTSRDKVKEVYLDQLQLTLLSPAGLNFNFLDTLRVYINTPGANNRILLAQTANPPTGVNTLTLTPSTARLDEYLKSDKYQLTVYSRQRANYFIRDSLTIRTDARFKVTASPL